MHFSIVCAQTAPKQVPFGVILLTVWGSAAKVRIELALVNPPETLWADPQIDKKTGLVLKALPALPF